QTSSGARVRGRRFHPDLNAFDLATQPLSSASANQLNPHVAGFGSSFVVSWEDDRNTASSGLDIFARLVPDLGTIASDLGTPIVTAAFRQTESDVAVVGPASFSIVWQD